MSRSRRTAAVGASVLLWLIYLAGIAEAEPPTPVSGPSLPPADQTADYDKVAREHVFHDLAEFGRYRAANLALPPPSPGERRVVFMGDSITDFWATVDPQFFARAGFIDRGISGQTTLQMLLRFRQDVIALQPTVVHILAGTNDIAGNTGPIDLPGIEANIASMVDLAQANGIQVVVGSVLPAKDFSWRPGTDPGPKIVALNQWLKRYTVSRHLIYADYYAALNDGALGMRSDVSSDGVHPLLPGYLIMDPLADAAIHAALRHRTGPVPHR